MSQINCPHAKTYMTPCIARDGLVALADEDRKHAAVCVGCGNSPRILLKNLAERYEPARRFLQTKDPAACAERLKEQVAGYVETR